MGFQPYYDERSRLLWAGLRARRGKITESGTPNRLNSCVIFTVYTHFTNVTALHTIRPRAMGWRPMI